MGRFSKITSLSFPTLSLFLLILWALGHTSFARQVADNGTMMEVGLARINITPEKPIRLAGYGARSKAPSQEIIHQLEAKAIAFGSDEQGPSILITVDLVGIPGHITSALGRRLADQVSIDPAQLAICSSHTHGGPEVGNLLNILQYRG
ncbi:MAG TPA: hypothetical protein VKZ51_11985, partial [Cyclobacteriaceae bacterium]|nr:hypothetical protein [Cyclobacteriaceae bacterium]